MLIVIALMAIYNAYNMNITIQITMPETLIDCYYVAYNDMLIVIALMAIYNAYNTT